MKKGVVSLAFVALFLLFAIFVLPVGTEVTRIKEDSLSKPSSEVASIHQGDLIISGNTNYTIIDERFDINGSIIVEENATLYLKNAIVNFTQVTDWQYNMTFRNPANGNPRLQATNVTLTSSRNFGVYLYENSSATAHIFRTLSLYAYNTTFANFSESTMTYLYAFDSSVISLSKPAVYSLYCYNFSVATVLNSTNSLNLLTYGSSTVSVLNSSVASSRSYDSSVVSILNSEGDDVSAMDSSIISISNSKIYVLRAHPIYFLEVSSPPFVSIYNSTISHLYSRDSINSISNSIIGDLYAELNSTILISNSTVKFLSILSWEVNSSIINLRSGFFEQWNFWVNCSVVSAHNWAPNITVVNTQIHEWNFIFGYSNVTIVNTELGSLNPFHYSVASVLESTIGILIAYDSFVSVSNSIINSLYGRGFSFVYIVNSTHGSDIMYDSAKVYICWFLDVHVMDSISQDVPSANVTVTYPNGTVVESMLSDANGWARLTLIEKMINASGIYPVGNYTVTATYKNHSGEQTVKMTGNKQITIRLPFIIPEFPTMLIMPLLIITTLIAVIFGKTIPSNVRKGKKQT